jgi:hypothetical protein
MISALGYMVKSDQRVRNDDEVERFVLLPDVGTAVHPAHRFGDPMIDLRLSARSTVRFSERRLVWASPLGKSDPFALTESAPHREHDLERGLPAGKYERRYYPRRIGVVCLSIIRRKR